MSFALTKRQYADGSKDVTRRLGWEFLRAGEHIMGVEKGMGLRPGEQIVRLGPSVIVSTRREPLRRMLDDIDYGFDEIRREGFADHPTLCWPSVWVEWFCSSHKGCTPETIVTRIEFKRVTPGQINKEVSK